MLKLLKSLPIMLFTAAPLYAEQYIALAVSETTDSQLPGAVGLGFADTKSLAEDQAIETCRQYHGTSCKVVETQRGGCYAMARATSAAHDGIGMARTQERATSLAMTNCEQDGSFSGCTLTHRGCYN